MMINLEYVSYDSYVRIFSKNVKESIIRN